MDTLTQLGVKIKMKLIDSELYLIRGGYGLSATLLNSISRLITVLLDLGRAVGTSIYRNKTHNYCR